VTFADRMRRRWCRLGYGIPSQKIRLGGVRISATVLVFLSAMVGPDLAIAQSNVPGEYQVKAAFLFYFAQFVEWPQETFKNENESLMYCTIGEDPFQGALDASLNGKTIGAHPLRVRHAKRAEETPGCQVLFIGEGEKKLLPTVLAVLKGNPALIVGESEHFVQNGGTIGFCLEENKIRFEVNLDAAETAKLRISSRLLVLAKTIIGRSRGT
jgi:hypothetical protein